jgi:fructose-1,6-bisphosphatase/sedoheptulose 1,7-bisphosphatase-like protein
MSDEGSLAGMAIGPVGKLTRVVPYDLIFIRSEIESDLLERLTLTSMQNATTAMALAASHFHGRGDRHAADFAAVQAGREVLNKELLVPAQVVIGEGERDEAPMLYIGEILGPLNVVARLNAADEATQEREIVLDIAADPLEGTNLCADGKPGAIAILGAAIRGEGRLLRGPDGYMRKLVFGSDLREAIPWGIEQGLLRTSSNFGLIDHEPEQIVHFISQVRQKPTDEVKCMVLDRAYNAHLISRLRALNVQLDLITDGDITAGFLALEPEYDIDCAIGIGAAPEGVLTAILTQVYGGYMEARLWTKGEEDIALEPAQKQERLREQIRQQRERVVAMGQSFEKLLHTGDLAYGNVMFSLTMVTYNQFRPGVKWLDGGTAKTWTISGRSRTGSVNVRETLHRNPPARPQVPRNGNNH